MSKKLAESLTAGQRSQHGSQVSSECDTPTSISIKTQQTSGQPTDSSSKPKKKRLGKCKVCGKNTAKARCIKCNQPVCTSCYFHLIGICKKCLSKHTGDKWKGLASDWEKKLGVEWID